jgi:hypothetical protein
VRSTGIADIQWGGRREVINEELAIWQPEEDLLFCDDGSGEDRHIRPIDVSTMMGVCYYCIILLIDLLLLAVMRGSNEQFYAKRLNAESCRYGLTQSAGHH